MLFLNSACYICCSDKTIASIKVIQIFFDFFLNIMIDLLKIIKFLYVEIISLMKVYDMQ